MTETELYEQRKTAIHLLRSGMPKSEVAQELDRCVSWVYKWEHRYEQEGWAGLHGRSRSPKDSPNRIPTSVRQCVREARSELEAEAATKQGLQYIGAPAVQAKLKEKKLSRIPSTASIERILRAADMTRAHQSKGEEKVIYPRLHPSQVQQLLQVDIVPHFLRGGQSIACFNSIDVVSRYPTGQAYERRRSQEAAQFLIQVWQQMGIPQYTQVDNEGCFSGGFTHPGVLGKVVSLALHVGTELVFSPVGHPQSNGSVERFHQDYDQHVWKDTHLVNRSQVQAQAEPFFSDYRHSRHHSALRGASPAEVHHRIPPRKLSPDFQLPTHKLPLTQGRIHFMRRVNPDHTVSVLNLTWSVPDAKLDRGVWATLELNTSGAKLQIYDAAPDALERTCLVEHPFPLKEPVQPIRTELPSQHATNLLVDLITGAVFRLDRVTNFLSTLF